MSNFFGFPKPRQAGFGSPDIPSGDIPLDTADEDVVLEGVIVDFGEADRKINLPDAEPGILDPFRDVLSGAKGEDINAFLQRMMRSGVGSSDLPGRYMEDVVSGTILVDADAAEDKADTTDVNSPVDVPEPTVESAESVADMLNVMGHENEKLQDFIADALKNIKK